MHQPVRSWILSLSAVSALSLALSHASARAALGEALPSAAVLPATSEIDIDKPSEAQPPQAGRTWALEAGAFRGFSGDRLMGSTRVVARRFLTDSLTAGLDVRHWSQGAYPLSTREDSGAWAAGGSGQLYLFQNKYLGGYLGASLLWVPTDSQVAFAPEAGIKWFATQRFAIGITYWILTDLRSYTASFEPPVTGRSRQNLGLELSIFL